MIPIPVDFPVLQSEAAIVLNLDEQSREVFDGKIVEMGPRVLYEKEADKQLPVASLTKMMTTLVVLEKVVAGGVSLNDEVKITPEMLVGLEGFAVVGLQVGQIWTVKDLLYAVMLPSAGDAAQAVAIATKSSLTEFVAEMNRRAKELGLTRTHFANTVGFDMDNYSTARDMAKLLIYALKNEEFVKIFDATEYYLPEIEKTVQKTVTETARKRGIDTSVLMGTKTGFTYAAGRCLASTAKVKDVNLLMVNLKADYNGVEHIKDAIATYQYLGENYSYRVVKSAGEVVWTLPVENSPQNKYEIKLPSEIREYLPNLLDFNDLKYDFIGADKIADGVKKGEKLGIFTVKWGEQVIYAIDVLLEEEIYYHNWLMYVGVGIGTAAVVLMGVRFRWKSKK